MDSESDAICVRLLHDGYPFTLDNSKNVSLSASHDCTYENQTLDPLETGFVEDSDTQDFCEEEIRYVSDSSGILEVSRQDSCGEQSIINLHNTGFTSSKRFAYIQTLYKCLRQMRKVKRKPIKIKVSIFKRFRRTRKSVPVSKVIKSRWNLLTEIW